MYLEQEKSFFDVEELQASLHTWTSQSNKTPRCELHIVRSEPEGHYPHVNVYKLTTFWLWADNVFRCRVQPCFPPLREAVEKHVFVCLCSRLSTWFHFVNFAWTVLTWFLGGYEIQFHFTLWIECRGIQVGFIEAFVPLFNQNCQFIHTAWCIKHSSMIKITDVHVRK